METVCVIAKEDIPKYHMASGDVLTSSDEKLHRKRDIDRAMLLGNNEHQKVKIMFETTEGPMMVETTVWEVTQNYLILKSNVAVPIRCVRKIEFFE